MGRGADEGLFEVERTSGDDLGDLDRVTIGGLKLQLQALLKDPGLDKDFLRQLVTRAGHELDRAEQAQTVESFQSALSDMIQRLEPSDDDALIRRLLYPLAFEQEWVAEIERDCAAASACCRELNELQALWRFADAPEALQQLAEDADPDDFVLWQATTANFLGEGPRKHCFLMRQLAGGWLVFYRAAAAGDSQASYSDPFA